MPHIRKTTKRVLRKITGRRQKQPGIQPTTQSANTTSEDPSATGGTHIQQEQPGDGSPSASPASPQQPSAAQSLWDRAYNALAKQMPDLVKDYDELLEKEQIANSAPNESTSSYLPAPRSDRSRQAQLNTVIQTGLQRMEDNKTKYTIAGHEFVLADQITQVSNLLLWGKDWIGSAVKESPEASLVWSAVCLIFPLFTNPTTAAEANKDGFVYVTSRMRYYVALEPIVSRLGQNARVDEAVVSAANDHIVDLYQAILEFQLSSVIRFYQGRLKTYVGDIVPSRDWDQTRLDIKTREDTVNGDLAQINQLVARQELELLNKTSEETRATMEDCLSVAMQQLAVLNKQLTVMKLQQAAQEDANQERLLSKQWENQLKCLQLFYLTPNGDGATYDWYKDRVEIRVKGTCGWFLQHEHYQKWLSQESGPLLVSADPGCGKSVLAKYLIDHGLAQQSATICYFFFKDQDQNTIRQALCALLHQLFSQKTALIQHAMELYNKMGEKLVQSETSLWTILRDVVRDPEAGPVIFVIDALDECDESQLSSLIPNLKNIFCNQQLANAKFKVLMTSRPYEHIVSEFRSLQVVFQHIHIPGEEKFETISQEINSVIHHRVEQLAEKHELPDRIKSALERKLLAIDHRTYLWVYLVFDYLEKGFKTTDAGIDAAIQTLPKNVNLAYGQILNRSREDEAVKTVKKALCIILAARRPLTLSEMNIAMNLDGQGRGRSIHDLDLEQDKHFKTRLRTLCGLFVSVHHDKIYFLHQTAREFLIQLSAPTTASSDLQWQHSITTRHAHSVLAEICMFYLDRLNSTHTQTFRQDDHQSAFVRYSSQYWGDHCREAGLEKGSAMLDLASGLCTPDLTSHSQWASIISKRFQIQPESSTNVLVASRLGLTPVTEFLLNRGSDIEANDSRNRTALMLAADSGHEAVIRLLLENGADIGARDNYGWMALMFAAMSGHEAVTRLLLKAGADVAAKNKSGQTALMLAARSSREAVMRLLFKNGAGVDAMDHDGWTALSHAVRYARESVIRLLLDNGANLEVRGGNSRTTLMIAVEFCPEAVTRLLLEAGADVAPKTKDGWTALIYAARHGHEVALRLLLEKRADIEARNNNGWTPLLYAVRHGHEDVTRLLVKNGVDIEAKNVRGWTALMLSATSGNEAIMHLLLENGADVEVKDDNGWTALIHAARFGHKAVTQLLLENGADVEAKDDDGWTALIHAARFGHEAVTQQLLHSRADVEARDTRGWTALMLAAASGRKAVTRLLLDNRADVEAKDVDGWTALIYAARHGHEAIIRLLLDNGADVEAKDSKGWTALRHAPEITAQLLLDNGAQVAAKHVEESTA